MFTLTVLGSGSAGNCALIAPSAAGCCRCRLERPPDGRPARTDRVDRNNSTASCSPTNTRPFAAAWKCSAGVLPRCRSIATRSPRTPCATAAACANIGIGGYSRPAATSRFAISRCKPFPSRTTQPIPVGFMFHHGTAALGLLTDLGFATKLVHERVRAATTLLIETNHDSALLSACTKRPWSVKQRIMSRHGQPVERGRAGVISQVLQGGGQLRRAVLGHLSRDCNRPELALQAMRAAAGGGALGLEICCASQAGNQRAPGDRAGARAPNQSLPRNAAARGGDGGRAVAARWSANGLVRRAGDLTGVAGSCGESKQKNDVTAPLFRGVRLGWLETRRQIAVACSRQRGPWAIRYCAAQKSPAANC